MTKSELASALRAEYSDDDVIVSSLTCDCCGRLSVSLEEALRLASDVDTLEEWIGRINARTIQHTPLPPAAIVAKHCRALAAEATARRAQQ